ncbi:MAG: DUF881 domain-containing protein [Patescibacteria group bacterium]|nr:DUF881 domain-containing protein [Patescibacteria group bacterium]
MKKIDHILIGFVCLILGFIIVRQFYLYKKVNNISQTQQGNILALEVASLINNDEKLRKEVKDLTSQYNQLVASSSDKKSSSEALENNLEKYKVILGQTKAEGPGIKIVFDERVDSTQVIDLINALKNIGAEAVSINQHRLSLYTSIEPGVFYPPTNIEVIGNKDLLEEALMRKGGIIDQIGSGNVQKQERLILPAL